MPPVILRISTKSQKPNSKQVPKFKSQTEAFASAFGIWCLVHVCDLFFYADELVLRTKKGTGGLTAPRSPSN